MLMINGRNCSIVGNTEAKLLRVNTIRWWAVCGHHAISRYSTWHWLRWKILISFNKMFYANLQEAEVAVRSRSKLSINGKVKVIVTTLTGFRFCFLNCVDASSEWFDSQSIGTFELELWTVTPHQHQFLRLKYLSMTARGKRLLSSCSAPFLLCRYVESKSDQVIFIIFLWLAWDSRWS